MLFLFKDYSNCEAILYYSYSFIKTLEIYKYFLTLRPNMKHGLTLQQKMFITTKKIIVIILKSLQ